jgi:hypothetical protein
MASSIMRYADLNGKSIRSGGDKDRDRGKSPCPYAQKFDLGVVLDNVTKGCMARNGLSRQLLTTNR